MSVLIIRPCAALQSWGQPGQHHEYRPTMPHPTKSGITGLILNAMGHERDNNTLTAAIAAARMSIRVDNPGQTWTDFQTTQNTINTMHKPRGTITSNRSYLHNACFTVALQWSSGIAGAIYEVLQKPARPLTLGRKSCPVPIDMHTALTETLDLETYPTCPRHQPKGDTWAFITETTGALNRPGVTIINDVPISLAERTFKPRMIQTAMVPVPTELRSEQLMTLEEPQTVMVDDHQTVMLPSEQPGQ